MVSSKSRILIIGATGFIGRQFTKASLAAGHPTFLLVREFSASSNPEKAKLLESFKASGANILPGSVEDYASVVEAIRKVDVVISAVGCLQLMSQMNIIKAIKEVGTIQRFIPSEYGVDYDRIYNPVGPIKTVVDDSLKIRRAVEAEGVPYTYIIGNLFAAYFVSSLGQLILNGIPPRDKIAIYGDGNCKVSFLKEEDVATFTIKTVDDPRTLNKSLHFMPPANTMSVNELVSQWEKMIGRTMEKIYVLEEELLKNMADTQWETSSTVGDATFDMSCCHMVYFRGDLRNFQFGPHGLEATQLYPDLKYTNVVEEYLSPYA
jgi:nucleoside-diphosphate-sugar epimerase